MTTDAPTPRGRSRGTVYIRSLGPRPTLVAVGCPEASAPAGKGSEPQGIGTTVHRVCRVVGGVLICWAAFAACRTSEKKVDKGVSGASDAGASSPDGAIAAPDAPVGVDAVIHADIPKPAVFVEFEKLLEAHTKKPATPARSLATCGLIRQDDTRLALLAPAAAPRPETATEEDWERATHVFVETEIDIAEMCEDMDGKAEGGEDEEVLRLLRQRYERLVELSRQP